MEVKYSVLEIRLHSAIFMHDLQMNFDEIICKSVEFFTWIVIAERILSDTLRDTKDPRHAQWYPLVLCAYSDDFSMIFI